MVAPGSVHKGRHDLHSIGQVIRDYSIHLRSDHDSITAVAF